MQFSLFLSITVLQQRPGIVQAADCVALGGKLFYKESFLQYILSNPEKTNKLNDELLLVFLTSLAPPSKGTKTR